MRIKYIGSVGDVAIPGGPLWAMGQERDLDDAAAAPYLRNVNFIQVGPDTAPDTGVPPAATPESSPASDMPAAEPALAASQEAPVDGAVPAPPTEGQ